MTSKTAQSSVKKIAEEYANRIWNQKEISTIDQLVHKDVLIHSLFGDFRGTQAMKEAVQAWLKGFPDLSVKNELIIFEMILLAFSGVLKEHNKGEFKGKKPSGKPVSYSGVTVYPNQK